MSGRDRRFFFALPVGRGGSFERNHDFEQFAQNVAEKLKCNLGLQVLFCSICRYQIFHLLFRPIGGRGEGRRKWRESHGFTTLCNASPKPRDPHSRLESPHESWGGKLGEEKCTRRGFECGLRVEMPGSSTIPRQG